MTEPSGNSGQLSCDLIERAARAAGHGVEFDDASGLSFLDTRFSGVLWDPLHNDGDEARLEAALSMDVRWLADGVGVGAPNNRRWEFFADHGGDKQKARRRAGVRAAAAMAPAGGEHG